MVPGTPYDSARVDALLAERGVSGTPDGGRTWRLKNGEISVGAVREGGQVVATELRVPLSDRTELIREVVTEAAALAQSAEVRLVDPQLSRNISASDDGNIAEQYVRTARYAGEMMGVSEAMGASFPDPTAQEGFRPTTKVVLGILGFFLLLYLLSNSLVGQLGGAE
ncbi:hypothetical protein P2318_25700 [Myxococcaceae bacterium GXIMD 01537]